MKQPDKKTKTAATIFISGEYFSFAEAVIAGRLKDLFKNNTTAFVIEDGTLKLPGDGQSLELFILQENLSQEQILVLLLALFPHVMPSFLDNCIKDNMPESGEFPLLGGTRGKNHRGFIPTGETAVFLLAGDDVKARLFYQQVFNAEHLFVKKNVLYLDDVPEGEPRLSGRIILSDEYIELFTKGSMTHPKLSMNFPAQHVETAMEWSDLVLNENTLQQITDLENWAKHQDVLMNEWGMKNKLKPGYRALFYGPPGTGKTLTATLLGKYTGKDVFRIDLSMVVSKFIGETEKNLSQLFNRAENKNWILFFDEADALFSKRTNVRDAHDKYANQEAAYLLQRIESFDGLVILATNFKNNIDEAFIRRFQAVVHFPAPGVPERTALWQRSFPENAQLDKQIDYAALAKKYEVTGAAILSIVQHCCLLAIAENTVVSNEMIIDGIKREYLKEGKIW